MSAATHSLKCWPGPFQAVVDRIKRHEVRVADRTYQTNDVVWLNEWDPNDEAFTGRMLWFRIGYVSRGPDWGIPVNMVVFTLMDIE